MTASQCLLDITEVLLRHDNGHVLIALEGCFRILVPNSVEREVGA